MATLMNREPAKVAPIAWRMGFFLNLLERIGMVPTKTTIIKKRTIQRTLRRAKVAVLSISCSFMISKLV